MSHKLSRANLLRFYTIGRRGLDRVRELSPAAAAARSRTKTLPDRLVSINCRARAVFSQPRSALRYRGKIAWQCLQVPLSLFCVADEVDEFGRPDSIQAVNLHRVHERGIESRLIDQLTQQKFMVRAGNLDQ